MKKLVGNHPAKLLRFRSPGKNPLLVLPGATLQEAARDAAVGAFLDAGQGASSTRWVIVHRKLEGEFLSHLDRFAGRFKVGDPLDPTSVIGPLASEAIRRAFLRHVRGAEAEGCHALRETGILATEPSGWYVSPSIHRVPKILENSRYQVHPVLGPDLPVFVVKSSDEAFALCNSMDSSLVASVHTQDPKLLREAKERLAFGRIMNCAATNTEPSDLEPPPKGGAKANDRALGEHASIRLPLVDRAQASQGLAEGPSLLSCWTYCVGEFDGREFENTELRNAMPAGVLELE